jgi:hypothetical protein
MLKTGRAKLDSIVRHGAYGRSVDPAWIQEWAGLPQVSVE